MLLWNLAADPNRSPYRRWGMYRMPGGNHSGRRPRYQNVAYYAVAHFSQFVPPGSVRIGSTEQEQLPTVAFLTPDGQVVLVVSNTANFPKAFNGIPRPVSHHHDASGISGNVCLVRSEVYLMLAAGWRISPWRPLCLRIRPFRQCPWVRASLNSGRTSLSSTLRCRRPAIQHQIDEVYTTQQHNEFGEQRNGPDVSSRRLQGGYPGRVSTRK